MRKGTAIAMLSSMIVWVGCKQEAPGNKPATTEMAKNEKAVEKAASPAKTDGSIAPGKYDVDAGHSVFLFKIRHLGAGFTYGWFKDVSGTVVVDPDLSKQSVDLTIKTASVDSRDSKRDDHLRSPDFFNAAQFPTITFKSTKIEPGTGNALAVTGDLTVHGVTKSITAQVTPLGSGVDPFEHVTHIGYETRLVLKRSDFDMKFMAEYIGDDVDLTIGIEAMKK
jgi:polyisoprenoid-binding protein YceI